MQPFPLLLSVATGIRTMMYCKNDGLRDYQQEMKLRLFKEWEFHRSVMVQMPTGLSLIHISEPTRQAEISYAVFCLKKKKKTKLIKKNKKNNEAINQN